MALMRRGQIGLGDIQRRRGAFRLGDEIAPFFRLYQRS
jgi:hypothetical protein